MTNITMIHNNLTKAKISKNDEFYTQLSDIEREVENYKKHFKGKVVYCNCDNPEWSNFFKYFTNAFDHLQLKKVITTHYDKNKGLNPNTSKSLNDLSYNKSSYKLELTKMGKIVKTNLKGNGDFRNEECIELLKESDIIVSNPPFTLFREYISQIMEYDKKFLIIGSNNSITYKNIFQHIRDNKIWLGVSPRNMDFILPDGNLKSVNANWFTNLTHNKRKNKITLTKTYKGNEIDYPKYENYNAIEVSKIKDIPLDYIGAIGVPITFMDKYNPEQFEIIGMAEDNGRGFSGGLWDNLNPHCVINGKNKFKRIFIKIRR